LTSDISDDTKKKPFTTPKRIIEIFCLLLILVFGWLDRVDQFSSWLSQPQITFHDSSPLIRGADSYFYLNFSRDLANGRYDSERIKELNEIQHIIPRPKYAPLISILVAKLSQLTSYPLIWVAVLLPAFLGPLLAIPLYLIGRFFGGAIMGLSGAVLGVFSPYYVLRSGLGWNDTDILIVTFLFSLTYCFLYFSKCKTGHGKIWLGAALSVFTLFIWWWHTAAPQVTIIFLFLVFVAGVYPKLKEKIDLLLLATTAGVAILLLSFWVGFDNLINAPAYLIEHLIFFSKSNAQSSFPNVTESISELQKLNIVKVVHLLSGGVVFFVLSIIGIILLIWKRFRDGIIFLLPIFAFCLMGIFLSKRFLIFSGPVLALGFGFFLSYLWQCWGKAHNRLLPPFIILAVIGALYSRHEVLSYYPAFPEHIQTNSAKGMTAAKDYVPDNGIIWTWRDDGFPLRYWSERRVVADGDKEHIIYLSLPLATSDQRLAANFIRFYATHGLYGMQTLYKSLAGDSAKGLELVKKICAVGPQKARELIQKAQLIPQDGLNSVDSWVEFFYPHDAPPIFLFARKKLLDVIKYWHSYGNWDVNIGDGPQHIFTQLDGVTKNKNGDLIAEDGTLQVLVKDGRLLSSVAKLANKIINNKENFKKLNFKDQPSLTILEHTPSQQFYLVNSSVAQSTAIQLFMLNKPQSGYFQPAFINDMDSQLWEVHPDPL
jgi:hypothetical protein